MKYYIYHYCLNENLPKEHPDFCSNCWVDECESSALSQQNWKYCKECEAKGFDKFTLNDRLKGLEIREKMVIELEKHKQENMSPKAKERARKMLETRKNNLNNKNVN